MGERIKRYISAALCLVLSLQLVGCGTLLYPERRGHRSDEIDLAVALMDGIGLLFFIIPGVIAFAVDIQTGALYLPPGKHSRPRIKIESSETGKNLVVMLLDPKRLNAETIADAVNRRTGLSIRLDDPRLIVRKGNPGDLAKELERLTAGTDPSFSPS